MTEKLCADCGEINSTDSRFCSNCGHSRFNDVPPGLHARLTDDAESVRSTAVIISGNRVVLASVLSGGLYLIYWFYITWKQLSVETKSSDTNYPVWHALTLIVPVYGLFRMHAHVRTINELAARQSVTSTIAPGLAVVLLLLSDVLDLSMFWINNHIVAMMIKVISVTLATTLMAMAQGVLNLYWEKSIPHGSLRYARIGVGEVVFVIIGIILWILFFFPPSVFELSEPGF